jgi:hypothetical protein
MRLEKCGSLGDRDKSRNEHATFPSGPLHCQYGLPKAENFIKSLQSQRKTVAGSCGTRTIISIDYCTFHMILRLLFPGNRRVDFKRHGKHNKK